MSKQRSRFRYERPDSGDRQEEYDARSRNLRITLESLSTLARNDVGLVSITEDIDYSTPQGTLFTQMLGSFTEYFSGALSAHVTKDLTSGLAKASIPGGIP